MAFKFPPQLPQLPWKPPWEVGDYCCEDPRDFETIRGMLEFNAFWELRAIEGYAMHARVARERGDHKTADLLDHIRTEEEEHHRELVERLRELGHEPMRR